MKENPHATGVYLKEVSPGTHQIGICKGVNILWLQIFTQSNAFHELAVSLGETPLQNCFFTYIHALSSRAHGPHKPEPAELQPSGDATTATAPTTTEAPDLRHSE